MHIYRINQFELWGNARDGFDNNNSYELARYRPSTPYTMRYLTRLVRDLFQGRSFAWSENRTTYMSREGIELRDFGSEGYLDITYRGHIVGEVHHDELCKCGQEMRHHFNRSCEQLKQA